MGVIKNFPMVYEERGSVLPADFMLVASGKTQSSKIHELVNYIVSFLKSVKFSLERWVYVTKVGFVAYVFKSRFDLVHYRVISECTWAAQRRALPAGGWDETTPFCRNQLRAKKLPENAQSPTSRVHAVLGRIELKMATMHGNAAPPTLIV